MVWYILLVILGISLLVITHELGHYLMGKRLGFTIVEFSVGLGPKLFGIKGKETEFTLRALPIGGSCRFYGEDREVQDDRCFNAKPAWKRFLVVLAGPVTNILTCTLLCFAMLLAFGSFTSSNEQFILVQEVEADSPAERAGVEVGDVLVALNGERFENYSEFSDLMKKTGLRDNTLTVLRGAEQMYETVREGDKTVTKQLAVGGEEITLSVDTLALDQKTGDKRLLVSVARIPHEMTERTYNVWTAAVNAFPETWNLGKLVYQSIGMLITGQAKFSDMAGIIGTVDTVSKEVAEVAETNGASDAVYVLLQLIALIAVNLGIINLFPLPALDGGRLIFLILEMIRKKPVPPEKEGIVHLVGMVLLLALMVALTVSDLLRCFGG